MIKLKPRAQNRPKASAADEGMPTSLEPQRPVLRIGLEKVYYIHSLVA